MAYIVRAVRWALLLRHNKRFLLLSLLGTQVIGFTAIALIGRVADPVRPYLVAKKTGLPLSNQTRRLYRRAPLRRRLDGSDLFIRHPGRHLVRNPRNASPSEQVDPGRKVGTHRHRARRVLSRCRAPCRRRRRFVPRKDSGRDLCKRLGHAVGDKIRSFHQGLDILRTLADFGFAAGLSLGMWMLITLAYLESARAFVASPQLASMTLARCVLLLAVSGGASVLQLPIIGWFTQIGIVSGALVDFLGVAWEPAIACAAVILLVSFLAIVPVGLIWARFEHVNLRKVTVESEHAGEVLTADEPA